MGRIILDGPLNRNVQELATGKEKTARFSSGEHCGHLHSNEFKPKHVTIFKKMFALVIYKTLVSFQTLSCLS